MEEIVLPSVDNLHRATKETVDRFSFLARMLLTSSQKHNDFITSSMNVMKAVSKQTFHVNNLFGILGEVTLSLITEDFNNNKIRVSENVQLKERKPQVITIDDTIIKAHKEIERLTKVHTTVVGQLRDAQKVFWKLDDKTQKHIGEIKKAQCSQFYLEMVDGWSSDVTAKHHKKAYATSVGNSDQAESVFYRLVEKESAMRKILKRMNENLQNEIKNKTVQCIDSGLDDLRQVVKLFQQNSRTDRCLKLLSDIDKMSIADTLIDGTSRTYFCPKVMGYEDIHGYRTMPQNITMDTNKPKTAGFKFLPGLIQDTKTKVAVVNITDSKVTGAMTLKKGMKITQTLEFGNLELGFGYHRRNFLQQKTWGFYHKDQTQAC